MVRVETEHDVWHIGFSGVFMIRGTVRDSLSAAPRILYAGTIRRGFARFSEGVGFAFSPSWDWGVESFFNVSDEKGNEVLSKKGREENPHQWMEIKMTREAAYQRFVGPLLILWGGLRILKQNRPWLIWLPSGTSERSARRVLDEWVSSVAL